MINIMHKRRGWYFGIFTNHDILIGVQAGFDDYNSNFALYVDLPFMRIMAGRDFSGVM